LRIEQPVRGAVGRLSGAAPFVLSGPASQLHCRRPDTVVQRRPVQQSVSAEHVAPAGRQHRPALPHIAIAWQHSAACWHAPFND
jgi:hypothetical protein